MVLWRTLRFRLKGRRPIDQCFLHPPWRTLQPPNSLVNQTQLKPTLWAFTAPFTHFPSFCSSRDSPLSLLPPSCSLSHRLYLEANLLKTAISSLPPHRSSFVSPTTVSSRRLPSAHHQTSPSSHLSARPPSLIPLSSHLHPSFFSPQTPALFPPPAPWLIHVFTPHASLASFQGEVHVK